MYGKTVTIELDHSDIDLNELMEIFKGLTITSGFSNDSWNSTIKELADEIHEDEREDLKKKLNEWKNEDECDECNDEYKDLRHSFGSWAKDSEEHKFKEFGDEDDEMIEEDYKGQFKDWENETPIEEEFDEEAAERRMDIIGQNGNEGTHYTYDWDNNIKGYDYESNTILNSINDSITLIKDRMEDIDMRMDNIDEQLGILNADVANIEYSIENPIKEKLIDALAKYKNDVVDWETGEVSATNEVNEFDESNEFNDYGMRIPKKLNKKTTKKVMSNEMRLGKWQIDNKTKEVVKLDKTKVRKGKIKDLKK
jgi:hypothetical protein